MFTGIVEAVARVLDAGSGTLRIERPAGFEGTQLGDSIAVNGCCLTAVELTPALRFELSGETLERTNLGGLRPGDRVNLERAMAADGRFGGHLVQGHVDGMAEVVDRQTSGNSEVFRFEAPIEQSRYLIDKGSVTLDGVSLTMVSPEETKFFVWMIPHTLAATNFGDRRLGDRVNLEVDLIAKYVERLTRV